MKNGSEKKVRQWRIIAFVISVAFIIFMWVRKDISSIYATMPQEQIAPLVFTTVAVSLLKVTLIAGGILLIKQIVCKIKKK